MRRKSIYLMQYFMSIRKRLSCPPTQKKQLMQALHSGVETFLEENPLADMAAVIKHFGTPEQIAESNINEMETTELQKGLNIRRKILYVAITAILIALLMWGSAIIIALVNEFSQADGYHEIIVSEMAEGDTIPPMEGA